MKPENPSCIDIIDVKNINLQMKNIKKTCFYTFIKNIFLKNMHKIHQNCQKTNRKHFTSMIDIKDTLQYLLMPKRKCLTQVAASLHSLPI